jgi:hypothetical protein
MDVAKPLSVYGFAKIENGCGENLDNEALENLRTLWLDTYPLDSRTYLTVVIPGSLMGGETVMFPSDNEIPKVNPFCLGMVPSALGARRTSTST